MIRVKKQTDYHSSSDEDEDGHVLAASDALAPKSPQGQAQPKPILKRIMPKARGDPPIEEPDANEDAEEELAKHTALNTGLLDETSGEDDDDLRDNEPLVNAREADEDEDEDDDNDNESEPESATSMASSQAARSRKKRNDPDAFATSISKILDTKLTAAKRADPVLSRSKSAAEANKALADERLEHKVRAQMRGEKKAAQETGRVRDVLGLETEGVETGQVVEQEKRLKKTAQRGVVKLFNAVRAAQVKADEAAREARKEGVVGMRQREERVNEMSKQGLLNLISRGGKPARAAEA